MIGPQEVSPAETRLDWVMTSGVPFTPSEEATNEGGLPEPRPLTHSERAELEGPTYGAHIADYIIPTIAPRYVKPTCNHSSYDKTVKRLSDTARGDQKVKPPVKCIRAEAKTPGSKPLDIGEQGAVALANGLRAILAFPQPVRSVRLLCSSLPRGKYALSFVSLSVVAFGAMSLQVGCSSGSPPNRP